MEKVLNVFEKILESENLITDFLNLKNLEEIYDFCKRLDSSLTEEEFDLGVKDLMKEYEEISKLDESALEKIAGGKNMVTRFNAVAMAAIMLTSTARTTFHASEVVPESQNVTTSPRKKGFLETAKDKIKGLGKWAKNHPVDTALLSGTSIFAILATYKYLRKNIENSRTTDDLIKCAEKLMEEFRHIKPLWEAANAGYYQEFQYDLVKSFFDLIKNFSEKCKETNMITHEINQLDLMASSLLNGVLKNQNCTWDNVINASATYMFNVDDLERLLFGIINSLKIKNETNSFRSNMNHCLGRKGIRLTTKFFNKKDFEWRSKGRNSENNPRDEMEKFFNAMVRSKKAIYDDIDKDRLLREEFQFFGNFIRNRYNDAEKFSADNKKLLWSIYLTIQPFVKTSEEIEQELQKRSATDAYIKELVRQIKLNHMGWGGNIDWIETLGQDNQNVHNLVKAIRKEAEQERGEKFDSNDEWINFIAKDGINEKDKQLLYTVLAVFSTGKYDECATMLADLTEKTGNEVDKILGGNEKGSKDDFIVTALRNQTIDDITMGKNVHDQRVNSDLIAFRDAVRGPEYRGVFKNSFSDAMATTFDNSPEASERRHNAEGTFIQGFNLRAFVSEIYVEIFAEQFKPQAMIKKLEEIKLDDLTINTIKQGTRVNFKNFCYYRSINNPYNGCDDRRYILSDADFVGLIETTQSLKPESAQIVLKAKNELLDWMKKGKELTFQEIENHLMTLGMHAEADVKYRKDDTNDKAPVFMCEFFPYIYQYTNVDYMFPKILFQYLINNGYVEQVGDLRN